MKGEQLQNFVEHLFILQAPEISTPGAGSSETIRDLNRRVALSTGSAMAYESGVYSRWALRAWSRQGRIERSPSCETESEGNSSGESSEALSRESERERKQRKLWAYRQRVGAWANPLTWTRPAFRRKLNANFVDALMTWPPHWTSARTACGPEVMASWRFKAQSLCEALLARQGYRGAVA